MTSAILQIASEKHVPVSSFEDVGRKLGEIASLLMGLEAEVRRAHTEIATDRLERSRMKQTDAAPVMAADPRIDAIMSNISAATSSVTALADAFGTHDARIGALEATVGQIGAEFIALTSRNA